MNKDDLRKNIDDIFNRKFPKEEWFPKHHEWEENGKLYSCWEISKGIFTGDGGYREFCKIFHEEATKDIDKLLS